MDILENYLTNRSQKIIANGILSDELCIKCGVPQGSILGPLLFLVYINNWNASNLECMGSTLKVIT